jgi:O-antigen/teichoic acid export membrane protein
MSEDQQLRAAGLAQGIESTTVIARNAFYLVLGQVTTTTLAIFLSAALGRYLGVEDFGLYYLITTMCTFAYVFVEWGQPLYAIRQIARTPSRSGELLGTALALRAAFTAALAALAGLAAMALGYDARTRWLAVLLILASLPLFLAQGYGLVFRGLQRMGRHAAVLASNKASVLCIALPVLALGAGIPGVILAHAVAGTAALGLAVALYRQLPVTPLRASSAAARELLAGGTPILAMTVAVAAQPYLDAVILSKLAAASAVGWFGAAKTILGTLMAPATILGQAAYPSFSQASGDSSALRRELRSALRSMLWLGALAGAGTYLFADSAIELIYASSEFDPAATILKVFAPGFFLLFIDILLATSVFALGRGTALAAAKILSVAVGTALDFLLIPYFQYRFGNGGIGVVVAFALSEIVVFAGALIILRRRTLERAMALDVARAVGAAAVTLVVFGLLPPISPWLGIPLCVAMFAAASLAFGLVSRSDLSVLRELVQHPRIDPARR